MTSMRGTASSVRFRRQGFTLTEILIAVAILLIGVVAALQIFPPGFAAYMAGQQATTAQRLISNSLTALQEDANSLPDEIRPIDTPTPNYPAFMVAGDPTTAFSFNDLTAVDWRLLPATATGRWAWYGNHLYPYPSVTDPTYDPWPIGEPASVRCMRRIIGEKMMIPADVAAASGGTIAAFAPKATLRFGPIQVDTALNQLSIYDLRYRKVAYSRLPSLTGTLNSANTANALYYAMTPENPASSATTINFVTNAVSSAVRLSFFCLQNGDPTTMRQVVIPTIRNGQAITQNGVTVSYSGTQISLSDPVNPTLYQWTFIPGSEQINRAYTDCTYDPSVTIASLHSGQFILGISTVSSQQMLLGVIYFSLQDAGRMVKADYTVADWNVLHEDVMADNAGALTLSLPNPKIVNKPNYPREPNTWGLFTPIPPPPTNSDNTTVIMSLLDKSTNIAYSIWHIPDANGGRPTYRVTDQGGNTVGLTVDFSDVNHSRVQLTGSIPVAGHTFRVYYRAQHDWTLQVYKPPTQFWYNSQSPSNSLFLDWNQYAFSTATNMVYASNVYAGQSVAVDYTTRAPACTTTANATANSSGVITLAVDNAALTANATVLLYTTTGYAYRALVTAVNLANAQLTLSGLPASLTLAAGTALIDPTSPLLRVSGEVHTIPASSFQATTALTNPASGFKLWRPLIGTHPGAVRGVSVTVRALWMQPRTGATYTIDVGSTSAELRTINERWQVRSGTAVLPATKE